MNGYVNPNVSGFFKIPDGMPTKSQRSINSPLSQRDIDVKTRFARNIRRHGQSPGSKTIRSYSCNGLYMHFSLLGWAAQDDGLNHRLQAGRFVNVQCINCNMGNFPRYDAILERHYMMITTLPRIRSSLFLQYARGRAEIFRGGTVA